MEFFKTILEFFTVKTPLLTIKRSSKFMEVLGVFQIVNNALRN